MNDAERKKAIELALAELKKRNVSALCIVCNANQWDTEVIELTGDLKIFQESGGFRYTSRTMDVLMLLCGHCGFVRQHSLKMLGL